LDLWNKERKSVTDILSYKTVNVADAIAQSISSDSFEEATEHGVPRAIRPPSGWFAPWLNSFNGL